MTGMALKHLTADYPLRLGVILEDVAIDWRSKNLQFITLLIIIGGRKKINMLAQKSKCAAAAMPPGVGPFIESGRGTVPPCNWLRIPTGFRPKAQGCEGRATLGIDPHPRSNPNGVASQFQI